MAIARQITASMKNVDAMDIHPCSDTCPSCKSELWNSAIMVAMEGTTNAKVSFTATARNTGKLCGGVREVLLSDRWFSWAHPIEADIGLNASTGLAQEIKRFMVEYGTAVQMPSRPPKPNLNITNMPESIGENPPLAQASTKSTTSETVEEPAKPKEPGHSTTRSMLVQILMVIIPSMVCLIGANAFFSNEILAVLPVLLIFTLIVIIATRKAHNRKTKMAKNEDAMKDRGNWAEVLEHCAKDRERFQEEAEQFRIRYEESERKLREYTRSLEDAAIYEQQLAEYENKKISVLKLRERLWERTRLCMRCGTAYLGPG